VDEEEDEEGATDDEEETTPRVSKRVRGGGSSQVESQMSQASADESIASRKGRRLLKVSACCSLLLPKNHCTRFSDLFVPCRSR
jgi:hypothetical protein